MGADIHASVEYGYDHSPEMVMTFADVNLPRSYHIFGLLGYQGREDQMPEAVVPVRGWPRTADGFYGDVGWGFRRQAQMLVVRDAVDGKDGFYEGRMNEGDGTCITAAKAEEYKRFGSMLLPRDVTDGMGNDGYVYMSDPDIHSVNYVSPSEYKQVIDTVLRDIEEGDDYVSGSSSLVKYRAVLDLMQSLEKDPEIAWVRLIYGFDN